jgi:hypothetical protein
MVLVNADGVRVEQVLVQRRCPAYQSRCCGSGRELLGPRLPHRLEEVAAPVDLATLVPEQA